MKTITQVTVLQERTPPEAGKTHSLLLGAEGELPAVDYSSGRGSRWCTYTL